MKPRVPRSRHLKPNGKRSAYLLLAGGLAWSLLSSGGYAFAQSGPSITGYTINTSGSTQTVTVSGTNFGSSGTLDLNGQMVPVSSWSSSSVVADLPNNASPGSMILTSGGANSNTVAFRGWDRGYYAVTSAGHVTTYGGAQFYGDLSSAPPSPIKELVVTPTGRGYWLLAQNGQLYNYGDAAFSASALSSGSAAQFVALPSGLGGYILTTTGQVVAVGQATAYGNATLSTGTTAVSMALDPAGTGYWILTSTGAVQNFGSAPSWTTQTAPASSSPVSLIANQNGSGGWVIWNTGAIQSDNGAPAFSAPTLASGATITAVSATPNDRGLVLQTTSGVVTVGTTLADTLPSSTALAVAPAAAPNLVSGAYGFFVASEPNGSSKSSFVDLTNSGSQLSLIQPVWFNPNLNSNGTWTVGTWLSPYNLSNITTVVDQAHSEHVMVMPSVGLYYTPSTSTASDPLATSSSMSNLVSQIVSLTQTYNLDGITIDFENNGFGSIGVSAASQQYSAFIDALGQALHAQGKKLIIAVYPSPFPSSMYNDAQLQDYVDWINVMTYPMHNSSTPPGPTAGLNWQQYWIHQIETTNANGSYQVGSVSPSKLLLGLAPYAHTWSLSPTAGVSPTYGTSSGHYYSSDRSVQQMLQQNPGIHTYWDPTQGEIFFTTGSTTQAPNPAPVVANGSFIKVSGTSPVFWFYNGVLHHVPNVQVLSALGGSLSQVQSLPELPVATMGLPLDVPFPNGSIVRPGGGQAVYFIWHGVLRHIINPQVFYQLGLLWNDVRTINPLQVTWPVGAPLSSASGLAWPTGMIVRANGSPKVYMVAGGALHWITSPSVFYQMGFQFSQISQLSQLPPLSLGSDFTGPTNVPYATGTLVRLDGQNPVYYVQQGSLRWIPDASMFGQLGFQFQDVLGATSLSGLTKGSNVDSVSASVPTTSAGVAFTISADQSTFHRRVQDLQVLLSTVLDIHAVNHGATPPSYIPLWSDGYYGSYTAQAVTAFQNMAGLSATGNYNAATASALNSYLQKYNVGNKIWWDDTTQSGQVRVSWALSAGLAGVDIWRAPFESPSYYTMLAHDSVVQHN